MSELGEHIGVSPKSHGIAELFRKGNCGMYWDVVDAKITGDLEFRVTFADGLKGRVKMLPSHLQGVFAPLRDPSFFNRLAVTNGYVSWPEEIDLAPDAMHESIRQSGEWVLS